MHALVTHITQMECIYSSHVPYMDLSYPCTLLHTVHVVKCPSLLSSLQVKLSVLFSYIRACTFLVTFLVLVFNILSNGTSVGSNFWLAQWSNQQNDINASSNL